jgi:hypothetical protein
MTIRVTIPAQKISSLPSSILSSALIKKQADKDFLESCERAFWLGTLFNKLHIKIKKDDNDVSEVKREEIVMEFNDEKVNKELEKHGQPPLEKEEILFLLYCMNRSLEWSLGNREEEAD